MKVAFSILLGIHGLIHALGLIRAFNWMVVKELTLPISKGQGIIWGLCGGLFLLVGVLYWVQYKYWWLAAILVILVSQWLIFNAWSDAKWGSIPNVLILLVALLAMQAQRFEAQFQKDVTQAWQQQRQTAVDRLTEADIQHLPAPVQRYLRYMQVIGQPKVWNFRVVFKGQMRQKGNDWFEFTSAQYNFIAQPARYFFMKASLNHLPTNGYHAYQDQHALMLIKLLSTFAVIDIEDASLFQAETVTFFNDLCLLAPAALIDPRISWTPIDDRRTQATFVNQGISISAILHINTEGQLIDFESEDRIDISDASKLRFSTPVNQYGTFNGRPVLEQGDAVWHYADGPFVYGRFYLERVEYNVEPHFK